MTTKWPDFLSEGVFIADADGEFPFFPVVDAPEAVALVEFALCRIFHDQLSAFEE